MSKTSESIRRRRLDSLDALRGLCMFLLLGGQQIVRAVAEGAPEGSWLRALERQFTHVDWAGLRLYDLIFPLFLFLMGVAIPIAVTLRVSDGYSRKAILAMITIRVGLMVVLGWCVHGRLLTWNPAEMRLGYSVLMMLGFSYLVSITLVLFTPIRVQVAVCAVLLIGYWIAQHFVPFPGKVPGEFAEGKLFSDWLFVRLVGQPGPPWGSPWASGWFVWLWPMVSQCLLGVFAGYFVRPDTLPGKIDLRQLIKQPNPKRSCERLCLMGMGCLFVGMVWSIHHPIVKNAWTSTFTLVTAGIGSLALAAAFAVIDWYGMKRGSAMFRAIGANSILAYLIATTFMGPFWSLQTTLFGGAKPYLSPYVYGLSSTLFTYGATWCVLMHLYRHKIFLRL
jgi:predicted acyltransferase